MTLREARAVAALANGAYGAAVTSRYVKVAAGAEKALADYADVVEKAKAMVRRADLGEGK